MVDSIVEFLLAPHTNQPDRRPVIAYALCNSLGSIVLVYENRRVVRKANVRNQSDIRVNTPLDYLRNMASEPVVTILLGAGATVFLMYCHQPCEKLNLQCRQLLLLGPAAILFTHYRTQTVEAQQDHAKKCTCGHMCHSQPPTYQLAPGDRITLNSGVFYVSASSEQHRIYMSKQEFLNQVTFSSDAGPNSALAFVNSLPDDKVHVTS